MFCVALVAMVYADGGAEHREWLSQALRCVLSDVQKEHEENLGQGKRNAQKRNTAVVCGDYDKGGTICYILFVVMCGDGAAGAGTEHKLKVPKRNF